MLVFLFFSPIRRIQSACVYLFFFLFFLLFLFIFVVFNSDVRTSQRFQMRSLTLSSHLSLYSSPYFRFHCTHTERTALYTKHSASAFYMTSQSVAVCRQPYTKLSHSFSLALSLGSICVCRIRMVEQTMKKHKFYRCWRVSVPLLHNEFSWVWSIVSCRRFFTSIVLF